MPTARDAPATPLVRYQRAIKELKQAGNEEARWLALGDAAKAAVWIGHAREARHYYAEALLGAGERQAVLQCFDLCRAFWPTEKLSAWKHEVEAGRIPDFGANVVD